MMMKLSGFRQTLRSAVNQAFVNKRRQYLSLRDLFSGEDSAAIESLRGLGTAEHPIAKKVNGRYVSPWTNQTEKRAADVMKYLFTRKQMKMKLKSIPDTSTLIKSVMVDRAKCKSTAQPHVTWIGHATCLYQTEGVFFLTDPLWSDRASFSQMIGPERFVEPPIEIEDLKIDVVLLSHTHYDHLDHGSAQRIGNKALWYVLVCGIVIFPCAVCE